jgi:hypothetical protein
MSNNGIVYTTTGTRERGIVQSYHDRNLLTTLAPLFLNKSKHAIDVSGLKKSDQSKAIKFDGEDYQSKFTIGFEVEKNEMSRAVTKEYELFCKLERDSSCGYEAVTHVLPLLPAGKWRTKVFDMMHKAEKIIDDRFSPSSANCGGHITIAVDGLSGRDLRQAIRKNSGIVLALFRNRLSNHYCGSNKRLEDISTGTRYEVALPKNDCLEFRLPSRFESVKQMMRRYELFYELVDFSVNNPNGSHEAFLRRIKPIILSMYNGEADKVEHIMSLSKHFRKYILAGVVSADINSYIR